MTSYTSSLLKLLDERGYIHQLTDAAALDALAAKEPISAYVGFDATASSLHVGSLLLSMCFMIAFILQTANKHTTQFRVYSFLNLDLTFLRDSPRQASKPYSLEIPSNPYAKIHT